MNKYLTKYDEDFINQLGISISLVMYIQFSNCKCLAFREGAPPITIKTTSKFDQLCSNTLFLHNFVQISANQCVNLHFLQSYDPTNSTLMLINNSQLKVVAKYKKSVKELFNNSKCPVLRLERLNTNVFLNKAWVLKLESMNGKTKVWWIENRKLETFLSKDPISSILTLLKYYDLRQCSQFVYAARCWVDAIITKKGSRTKELKIIGLDKNIALTRPFQTGMEAPSQKDLVQCGNVEFKRLHCHNCLKCILNKA